MTNALQSLVYDYLKDLVNKNKQNSFQACGCIGPQNGQPKCPCAMRYVHNINGTYYEIISLGRVND